MSPKCLSILVLGQTSRYKKSVEAHMLARDFQSRFLLEYEDQQSFKSICIQRVELNKNGQI